MQGGSVFRRQPPALKVPQVTIVGLGAIERVLPGTNARYRRERNQADERKPPRSGNREPAR